MLEIIILIAFSRALAKTAKEKGRSGMWAGLGVVCWIGGELMGGLIGGLLDLGLGAYALAILFAAIGALVAWMVVKALPPGSEPVPQF